MTAVEYIEKGILARERHWHDQYQQGYQRALSDMMLLVDDAKDTEKREMILLLNWILKHYETHTDSNFMFCWKSPSGQELDSVDLVEQYLKETYE